MKLEVRYVDVGPRSLALCEVGGDMLPGQCELVITQTPQDISRVTVTFILGKDVNLNAIGGSLP